MANTIDFIEEKDKREIDNQYRTAVDGVKWYKFAGNYTMTDGKVMCLDFWAINPQHADECAKAIRETFVVDGQLHNEMPWA